MAITIPATGSGTAVPIVATESVASAHYQLVKIVNSEAGQAAALKAVTVTTPATVSVVSAGTAVPLAVGTTAALSVLITALDTNAGIFYIGGSNVLASARRGTPLIPGSTMLLPVLPMTYKYDLSTIYGDGTNSDSVAVTYVAP